MEVHDSVYHIAKRYVVHLGVYVLTHTHLVIDFHFYETEHGQSL